LKLPYFLLAIIGIVAGYAQLLFVAYQVLKIVTGGPSAGAPNMNH